MSARPVGGIRHVVCIRWEPGTDSDAIAQICRELSRLPTAIPEIRAYEYGADLGLAEGNADFSIVAEVPGVDDILTMERLKTAVYSFEGPLPGSARTSSFTRSP